MIFDCFIKGHKWVRNPDDNKTLICKECYKLKGVPK